jgi:hypothetical protein
MTEECPICLSPISGTVITVGCCKKQFHAECLLKCTQQKNECPMCRVQQCIVPIENDAPRLVIVTHPPLNIYRCAIYSIVFVVCGSIIILISKPPI